MTVEYLLPDLLDDGAGFWEQTKAHRLSVQTCSNCSLHRHPPRPMCPRCRSTEFHWEPVSGRATIWSYVIPHPPLLPGYSEVAPYNVITVQLSDMPEIRMIGNLIAAEGGALNSYTGEIEIGAEVQAVYDDYDDQVTFVRWVLV
jgi:uncharacterized OB-fold protein